jgi:hypothetical protein
MHTIAAHLQRCNLACAAHLTSLLANRANEWLSFKQQHTCQCAEEGRWVRLPQTAHMHAVAATRCSSKHNSAPAAHQHPPFRGSQTSSDDHSGPNCSCATRSTEQTSCGHLSQPSTCLSACLQEPQLSHLQRQRSPTKSLPVLLIGPTANHTNPRAPRTCHKTHQHTAACAADSLG